MTAVNGKTLFLLSLMLALAWCQQHYQQFNNGDEVPTVLSYNSPLRKPDSLRSRPYFDFLSTLYRRDADKTQLFRPYIRNRREAVAPATPVLSVDEINNYFHSTADNDRSRRAIVFRPLFVYRQQEVKKQQLQTKRRV